MNYTGKILSLYASVDRRVKDIDRLIKRNCVTSYESPLTIEKIFENVMKLRKEKEILFDVKRKIDLVFSRMSEEDKKILKYRYFNVLPRGGFKFAERTFYRRLPRVEEKFIEYLSYAGLSEKSVKEKYYGIRFVKTFLTAIREDDEKPEYLKRKNEKKKVGAQNLFGNRASTQIEGKNVKQAS